MTGSPPTPPRPAEEPHDVIDKACWHAPKVLPEGVARLVIEAMQGRVESGFNIGYGVMIAKSVLSIPAAGWRPPAEGRPELIEKAAKALGKLPIDEPWPGFITPEIIERHMMWATRLDHVGLLAGPAPLRQLADANARIGRLEGLFNQSRRDAMRVIRAIGLGEDDAVDEVVARAEELFDRSLRQGEGEPAPDVIERAEEIIRTWFDPGGPSRDEAIADHAQELAAAGLLATTPPTPDPLRMAHEYGVKQRAALRARVQETACDRRSTTPPTQPAVVTEHAREMSGGGMHVRADYPEIENVYPLKDYIAHGQQHGGSVWRRQVVVVEDWTEVPRAVDVTPSGVDVQSPTENESPPLHVLPLVEFKHKTEGGMCCNGKHHMCGGPGSYCCSQTVYMHRHADGSTGPISTSPPPAPTENESGPHA